MAKHAPESVWAALLGGRWTTRLRITGVAALLLGLVASGVGWAIAGDPVPGSLPLRPPPSVELSAPPPLGSSDIHVSPSPSTAVTTGSVVSPAPRRPTTPPRTVERPRATTTPKRTPARTQEAPAPSGLTVQYVPGSVWDNGMVAGAIVRNTGRSALRFQVRISYPADAHVRLQTAWNATAASSGDTITFVGGPLSAGGQILVGFQAAKTPRSAANPTSCTVTVAA